MPSTDPNQWNERARMPAPPMPPRHKRSALFWLLALTIFVLALVLIGGLALISMRAINPPSLAPMSAHTGVLAIAFGVDANTPALITYIGDPAREPFLLPPGNFYIEAVDQNGYWLALGKANVQTPNSYVRLPASFQEARGIPDASRVRALKTIANGVAEIELTQLLALESVSNNFTLPPFEPTVQLVPAHLDRLYAQYKNLTAQQKDMLDALDRIESRASAAMPVPIAAAQKMPARGVFASIKDKLTNFFGYAGDAGKRASERIIQTAAQLNVDEREDAFNSIRPDFRGGAKNFDELVDQLRSGALNPSAAQIESDLRNVPSYGAAAQKNNQTVGQIVRQEGAELVVRGGELQAQVIKTVLADVFPDIQTGLAHADKLDEWAEHLAAEINDPLGTWSQELSDKAKAELKNRIKTNLQNCCGQLPANIQDKIANAISDKAVKGASQVIKTQLTSRTATPTAQKSATLIALASATLVKTPTPTGTPTPSPTPTATATNTPMPTPTPDTSWIDPHVQSIANQLMLQLVNPIQVALVTEDYRQCLLSAVNKGANQANAKAQCVNVLLALPTATPTRTPSPTSVPTPVCAGAPVISAFTANPGTINAGQSSTLNWGLVTNANAVYLDGDGVATPGSTTVKPGSTKTYTLSATGCGGTTSKQVTITVNPVSSSSSASAQFKYVCGMTIYHKEGNTYVQNFTLNTSSPDVLLTGTRKDGQKATASCLYFGQWIINVSFGTCKFDYYSFADKNATVLEDTMFSVSSGCGLSSPWRIELKMCNR